MSTIATAGDSRNQARHSRLIPWMLYLIFLAVLNETVFNVSTPRIAAQYGLGSAGVSWMMTIFMVMFGIGSVIYGKLADIFSLRKLINTGIVIYALGSLFGFVFQAWYPLVVIGRAIQGAGASAIPALIFVVVARYFPFEQRGRVFGLITATVSLSIGLGPVIGGFVSSSLHWSFLFAIPLLTVVSIPFLSRLVPEEAPSSGRLDIPGAILVALTVGSLIAWLNLGIWQLGLAFLFLLVAFIVRIRTAGDPFIETALFTNRLFRNGVIVGFSLFSMVIGIIFLVPLALHAIHGLGTAQIGLILFPGAISSVFFGPLGGQLADKRGNSFVVSLGLGLLVISLIVMAAFISVSAWIVCGALLLTYVGFSLFQTALVNSVSQTLPEQQVGTGMGLFNLISIISGAVGTAIVGKILDTGLFNAAWFPRFGVQTGAAYGNLLLVFAVIIVFGGVWYLRSYRGTGKPPAEQMPIVDDQDACVACD